VRRIFVTSNRGATPVKLQTLFADATASARQLFVIAFVIGSQVLMTGTASSATWTLNASLADTSPGGVTDTFNSGTATSVKLPNSDTTNQTGVATASVGVGGTTGFATVSASGGGTVNASAGAELNYDLSVTGPNASALVPVGVFALISTSAGGGGTASASINVNGIFENGSNGTGFNGEMQLHLMPGTYLVVLQANAAGFGDGSSGSATADPHFFIDTSFDTSFDPTGYSVSVDSEVGNGFPPGFGPTVTPPPATLPLFATGIGGLGLLGWRRKQNAAHAA
jgi:hypothetical protein